MIRLAKTLLTIRGELDQLKHLEGVFENHALYHQVFGRGLLEGDEQRILLCCKLFYRLKRFSAGLQVASDRAPFLADVQPLLWALLCQGVLNDPSLSTFCDSFGADLVLIFPRKSERVKLRRAPSRRGCDSRARSGGDGSCKSLRCRRTGLAGLVLWWRRRGGALVRF